MMAIQYFKSEDRQRDWWPIQFAVVFNVVVDGINSFSDCASVYLVSKEAHYFNLDCIRISITP